MTKGEVDLKIVDDRAGQVRLSIERLRTLGMLSAEDFRASPDHEAAAETYLRRALEALCDIGRHLLAKGFQESAPDYASVARRCGDRGILTEEEAALFRRMTGYRNRLVHRYFEVTTAELHDLARDRVSDIERVLQRLVEGATKLVGRK